MPASANVRVATTGAIYVAPTGTTLPTTPTGALNAAFLAHNVGYISEDGISMGVSEDITDIKAWQNASVVRKIQTGHDVTFHFTMLETASDPLSLYFGNFAGSAVTVSATTLAHNCYVIQIEDGDDDIRIVIPDGQVTERGDLTFANGDAIKYEVTLTAFPDGSGNKAYIYMAGAGS